MRIVAIDGPSGGGKSTYAATLPGTVVPTDHFATWDDPVSWWPRLVDGVVRPLMRGEPGRYRRMDWVDGVPRLGAEVVVEPTEILIIEGVSSGRKSAAPWLSELIWVEAENSLERAVRRDGEASRQNLLRWKDFECGWFAVDDTRNRADLVVTSNTVNP
jgi:energy-coupling factor transporter ATP-binding protein EcfA2